MALLHAFAAWRRSDLSAVATFDHGTGPAAEAAAELVVHLCLRLGVPVASARAARRLRSEADFRAARWSFLRAVAAERRAVIVTAHTLDDQAETVAMRILRGTSTRGLSAMAAPTGGVCRPLLGVRRADVARYAESEGVPFIEDPSNATPAYLRNRIRADFLPAAEAVRPGFAADLAALGDRAAHWRLDMAALVDALGCQLVGSSVVVDADPLLALSAEGLSVVWPEVAGRAGFAMDRRGIERVVAWTPRSRAGQRVPISGGGSVQRTARTFVVAASVERAKRRPTIFDE